MNNKADKKIKYTGYKIKVYLQNSILWQRNITSPRSWNNFQYANCVEFNYFIQAVINKPPAEDVIFYSLLNAAAEV